MIKNIRNKMKRKKIRDKKMNQGSIISVAPVDYKTLNPGTIDKGKLSLI